MSLSHWVVCGILRVLFWFWGRYFQFFFRPAEPPARCRARVRVKRRYLRHRTAVAFSSIVQFRPADALLSPEPGGDQGTLLARNVVQGYVRACVSSFFYFVRVVFDLLFFRLNSPPPRGAVGDATFFHPGYLSFPRLTPRHADSPRDVFGLTSPLC